MGFQLHKAVKKRDAQLILDLLNKGANVNIKDNNGCTPLHYAVKLFVDCEIISKLLLDHGANVNAKDGLGCTPLHIVAARHSRYLANITKILIEAGADLDAGASDNGYTPLHVAVQTDNYLDIIKLLVKAKPNVAKSNICGWTPLHLAISSKNISITKVLLDNGVEVNSQDDLEKTALYHAVKSENLWIVELLLEAGAKVNIQDHAGKTPLRKAVELENIEIVELLLKSGADVSDANLVYLAAESQNINILKLLKDFSPKEKLENSLHLAVKMKNVPVLKILLEAGADVSGFSDSPLHLVTSNPIDAEILKLLQEAGASLN